MLKNSELYRALVTRDRRFDGRFFVGVTSTKIYCRPVCAVRIPAEKNCRFFISAAAAEVAGFRACKRCRPEIAPGNSSLEASESLARSICRALQEGALQDLDLSELAAQFDVTPRHLRRVFQDEFGVSPIAYAQTQRLLLANQMLKQTSLPITEVAHASGFKSLRRFNTLFKEHYRQNPSEYRTQAQRMPGASVKTNENTVDFFVGYRPPYSFDRILNFLRGRSVQGVEAATDDTYLRTVEGFDRGRRIDGIVQVSNVAKSNCLRVRMDRELLPVCAFILERIRHLFDTDADPTIIEKALGSIDDYDPSLRVPGCFSGFEMIVRAILGQQISVRAAQTLAGRFAKAFGSVCTKQMETDEVSLSLLFPRPETIAKCSVSDLRQLGIAEARAATILEFAQRLASGRFRFQGGGRIETTLRELQEIRGVGEWTAQYIAMRAFRWPDAFPHTDLGVKKALPGLSPTSILKHAEQWSPWRAYATIHFWTRNPLSDVKTDVRTVGTLKGRKSPSPSRRRATK